MPESYETRAETCSNPLTRSLLTMMSKKKSNLCVAVDVTSTERLLSLLPQIGPHIVVLKLHIDILSDFEPSLIAKLVSAKRTYGFLIFEDRKFADIGSTVASQYRDGVYRISSWSDLVTVHSVPGPGPIDVMHKVAQEVGEPRGILLLSEMSSAGNLCTPEYASATVSMAETCPDFVVGFISQHRTAEVPDKYLIFTPGVSLVSQGDGMGQVYKTPEDAVTRGSDVLIVGRGVYGSKDVEAECRRYRDAGWAAYTKSLAATGEH